MYIGKTGGGGGGGESERTSLPLSPSSLPSFFFFFVDFSPALYYPNAWNRLLSPVSNVHSQRIYTCCNCKKLLLFIERKTYAHEPDLQDLIEYLQTDDTTLIVNAANYLQHLSYSDEQVKVKVR